MSNRVFALAAGLCLAAASIVTAQPAPAAGQPPIVDRELFFGNPEIARRPALPRRRFIAFLKPWKDTRNVWVKKTAEPFEKARPSRPRRSARSARSSGAATASTSSSSRTRTATRTSTSTPSTRPRRPTAGQGRARRRATSPTPRACARQIYAVPKSDPDIDLRRPQRPRRRLARPLQGEDLDRRADARCARTPSGSPAGSSTSKGSSASPTRIADNGDTEILRVDPRGLHEGLHLQRLRDLRPGPLPQGRQARLHGDEQGRRRTSSRLRLFDPATGQGRARRVRPA